MTSIAGVETLRRNGYPSFSPAEIDRRHAALRAIMAERGVDLAITYGAGRFNSDMLYLSNWPGGREGYILLPAGGAPSLLLQFFNHVPLAKRLSLIPDTRWEGADAAATIAERVAELGLEAGVVGLIGPWTARDRDRLAALLPSASLTDLSAPYRDFRVIHSEEEMTFFRRSAQLTDLSMEALEAGVRPGMPEYELAALVEGTYLRAGGYAGIHFMAATPMEQPEAFVPHQYQSNRRIALGDVLITEISGSFWGYASQIHRTYVIGAEPTLEYLRLHDAAVETFEAVLSVLRAGATADMVVDAAEIIHRRGYTMVDDLLHGAEQYPPVLRTRATDHGNPEDFRFEENMVVTIQPNLATPDLRIGLQFGETVRITQDGAETLHQYRRELIRVPS